MEEWQASVSAAVVIFVALLATALLLRDHLTMTKPIRTIF